MGCVKEERGEVIECVRCVMGCVKGGRGGVIECVRCDWVC